MRLHIPAFVTLACLGGSMTFGLTDEEIFREFRFNLINPGARSLALGGAFIAVADDATAAQANPAGLAFLTQPEYFAELRVIDNGARSSVIRENLGVVNTFVASGTDIDDVVSPSFLSVVTTYNRWTMGLSRHEVLNVRNSTVSSFAFTFQGEPGVFLAVGRGSIDTRVTNYNVSVGAQLSARIAVGGTLTLSTLEVDSEVVNTVVDTNANVAQDEILEPTLDLRTSIDDRDKEVVYSLGFIYKQPEQRGRLHWQAGAVYRRAPRFSVREAIDPAGLDLFDKRTPLGTGFTNRFSLPDSAGVGASVFLFDERLTLAGSVERVNYSSLAEGFVPGVNLLTGGDARFDVRDATDYRAGAEYVLLGRSGRAPPLALRAGAFTQQDASISAVSTGSGAFATTEAFAGGGRRLHGTVGLGADLRRVKVDAAAAFSSADNQYVVSVIYQVPAGRPRPAGAVGGRP